MTYVPTGFLRSFHGLVLLTTVLCLGTPSWAQVSPQESLQKMKPAEGFEVTLWADEPMLINPTNMDIDSRGRVWVTEGLNYRLTKSGNKQFERIEGADKIKILEDTDGDGVADKVTVFAEDIYPVPMGLAIEEIWKDGKYCGCRLFVGNSPDLLVLEDTDGDDHADKRYPLLTGFGGVDSDHGVHGMALGLDGKLYFSHGDGCCSVQPDNSEKTVNFDVVDKSGRRVRSDQLANTLRVNLDGTQFETLCNRQRNNYEAALDSFGNVFVSDNDDDGNRGCRMIWVMDGGNYGYRTSSRHWGEELPGIVPKLVGTGNGSPCGLVVYEGDLFPREYQGAVLQVDAGTRQVNFHPLTRHGAAFRTEYKVLLASDDPWFRPVDATVAPDGSLYVCDWYDGGVGGHLFRDQTTGRIYRIAPKGKKTATAKLDFGSLPGKIEALKSPVAATRFAARQLLVEQGASALPAVQKLFREGTVRERARALFVIDGMGPAGRPIVLAALRDKDPRIREQALRILTRDVSRQSVVEPESARETPAKAEGELDHILTLATDADSGVRRELLLALREVQSDKARGAIRTLALNWDGQDRYYLEAIRLACRQQDSASISGLFGEMIEQLQTAKDPLANRWALPPYYSVTTNDAFLHPSDELPPACTASRIIGLAWVLGRPEALPALAQVLDRGAVGNLAEGVDRAIAALRDPRAAEFLAERFARDADVARRREMLALLGPKLAADWKPALDKASIKQVLEQSLESDELRVAAIRSVARIGTEEYGDKLLALAESSELATSARQAAIEALGQMRYAAARERIESLVKESGGAKEASPLALAAVTALASYESSDKGSTFLVALLSDSGQPLNLRKRAVQSLASMRGGGYMLLDIAKRNESLDQQNESVSELKTEIMAVLHSHPDPRLAEEARAALPLPKTAQGEPLPPIKQLLALPGDRASGETVFFRDRSDACMRCHRVRGLGNWVGPDLSSIGLKYGKDGLLDAILNPSASIAFGYQMSVIATTDGRVFTGLVAKQSPEEIVLKTAEGQRITLRSSDVEDRKEMHRSVMPDGLAETMSVQELVDLLAFLESLRQPVSTIGQYYVLGPLSDDSHGANRFDPSQRINLASEFRGSRQGTARWHAVATSDEGRLDLIAELSDKLRESVYVYVPIISAAEQPAQLVVDTASTLEVWLNGQVAPLERQTKATTSTWSSWMLHLPKGSSDLVIRVASSDESPGIVATLVTDTPLQFGFDVAR